MRDWLRGVLGRGGVAGDERWVVLDVESSGLDPRRDRLLAVAAIAVRREGEALRVVLGDSFETVLRQDDEPPRPDKQNILLHGIGVGAQRQGTPPAQALQAFERWAAGAPLIAFHAAFDEALLQRAMRQTLGHGLSNAWLDLEPLAAVLLPRVASRLGGRSLDHWMAHFGIVCAQRHQAAADTLATAELLLRLWPHARRERAVEFRSLQRLAAQRRWIPA